MHSSHENLVSWHCHVSCYFLQVKLSVFLTYARNIGVVITVSYFLLTVLSTVTQVWANFWLSAWSQDVVPVNDTEAADAQRNLRLGVYGAIGLTQGKWWPLSAYCLHVLWEMLMTVVGHWRLCFLTRFSQGETSYQVRHIKIQVGILFRVNRTVKFQMAAFLKHFKILGNITRRANNSEIHLHTPTSRQCSKRCLLV